MNQRGKLERFHMRGSLELDEHEKHRRNLVDRVKVKYKDEPWIVRYAEYAAKVFLNYPVWDKFALQVEKQLEGYLNG